MEFLEDDVRAEIYKERTKRVREYCKYMPNDTMIDQWINHPGKPFFSKFHKGRNLIPSFLTNIFMYHFM